jgi:hypothetical protein
MLFDFVSIKHACRLSLFITFPLLTCCATTSPNGGRGLARLHLFDDGGSPRFSFYFSCAGEVSAETELCWVASKYFLLWADTRHVAIKQLNGGAAFDAERGVPICQLAKLDTGLDYRIVVHFMPIAVPSDYDLVDGRGGYTPPKVGYKADVYGYAGASGKLVTQTAYHKKSDAPHRADAVPYIKEGVHAVLAALDPAYAQTIVIK